MLKRKKQIIAKVMATTMLASTLATTFTPAVNAAEPRATVSEATIAGGDRYKTAVDISINYTSTSKHAVIVNGEKGIVDALTATPYASLKKAPILMTESKTLNSDTKAELTRRGITTVDIVGGVNSVNDSVKAEIEAMGITVNRIAGNDKYDTALEVAKKIDAIYDISKIAVANGEVLADAVSVAAPAAQNKMPIILVHPTNGLDANTKTYLNGEGITNSYVIGGTTSVSDTIKNTLPGTKERLSGAAGTGRQETNAAVIKKFYPSSTYDNIYVAKSGQVNKADEIADALAVGVLAASKEDPVMLVGNSLVSAQKTLLEGKEVEKITKVGNGIPTASITAIKDTQKDPEATVSTVTLVNYKTIKITGKELNRIDKSKVSISGNTTSSYTANTTGTEATIEFASAFSNGTNTVKVTSNLGTVTSHTFTYSTGISTVEATTKEAGIEGIQYLEFTVNGGQKRSIEELKALGWTVEFKSNEEIFYNEEDPTSPLMSSKTGKLKTSGLEEDKTYYYEVILTNESKTIKTAEKKALTIVDNATDLASIKSYDATFTSRGTENNSFKSNKLLVGESIRLSNIVGVQNDGKEIPLTVGNRLQSSNDAVLIVSDMNITARSTGKATITIFNGDVTKDIEIEVLANSDDNKREVKSVSYYVNDVKKTSITLTKSSSPSATSITVKALDQYEDPINELTSSEEGTADMVIVKSEKIQSAVMPNDSTGTFSNGEAIIKITPVSDEKGKGTVKIQKSIDGKETDLGTLTVNIKEADPDDDDYDFIIHSDSVSEDLTLDRYDYMDDNSVTLQLNQYDSNGNLKDDSIDIPGSDYEVEVSDSDLISLDPSSQYNNGKITVYPSSGKTKVGTAKVYVYKRGDAKKNPIASSTITIKDTTPVISTIEMNKMDTITKINTDDPEFDLLKLFKITYTKINPAGTDIDTESHYKKVIEGVKVAKGSTGEFYENQEVLMSLTHASSVYSGAEAILFIDRPNNRGNKNGQYDTPNNSYHTKGDFVLATIKIELSGITIDSKIGETSVEAGKRKLNADTNDGSIIVARYDGVYDATKTPKDTVINVKIPR